jgi:hypothetical protein
VTGNDTELFKDAIGLVESERVFKEKMTEQARQESLAKAYEALRKNGGQVTNQIRSAVAIEDRAKLVEYAVKASRGEFNTRNSGTYLMLDEMYRTNPQRFASQRLDAYANDLTAQDLKQLKSYQDKELDGSTAKVSIRDMEHIVKANMRAELEKKKGRVSPEDEAAYRSMSAKVLDEILAVGANERATKREIEKKFEAELILRSQQENKPWFLRRWMGAETTMENKRSDLSKFSTQETGLLDDANPQTVQTIRRLLESSGKTASDREVLDVIMELQEKGLPVRR